MIDNTTMKIIEIKIKNLIPFSLHTANDAQVYKGERLEQLMNSIKEHKLISPITVRPIADGKYEIICGHNRANAMKALGYDTIHAVIKNELSDDEAKELYYDSNLNQQSFADWNYSQKIEAVKYIEKLIKENSHQGKRTDLDKKKSESTQETASVQSRQKLQNNSKQKNTRDKMAKRLGISTSTLSKYRSIIKLPDDELNSIAQFLDQKKISFEIAYRVSQLAEYNVKWFIECVNEYPNIKIDIEKLKALGSKRGISGKYAVPRISKDFVKEIFIPNDSFVIKRF